MNPRMNQETSDNIHQRVVIHVDIDYFYAQVEEILNPDLKDQPFGIQQGVNVVTCNYIARSFGVKKWRPLKECLEKCPKLVLVNGEDLSNYKIFSKQFAELLHSTIGPSERMGLDEHYMDITNQVESQLSEKTEDELKNLRMTGPIFPNEESFDECKCGCEQRLILGSQIAQKLRDKILQDLKLTCSVGIAHNKLLAKLVGQLNKPNNQTVLAPMSASMFMVDLKNLRTINGIGEKTACRIEELGISSIEDLQNCEIEKLQKNFGADMANRLKEMAMGSDSTEVKPSGKPKTVGLEDSCRPISIRRDAVEMFQNLLPRLMKQIQDDGRIPQSIKATVRKYDPAKKSSIRETKQCSLPPSQFKIIDDKVQLTDGAHDQIVKCVMNLFDHLVDAKQKFYINLLGLCFNKFQEQKSGPGSISRFLTTKSVAGHKDTDIENQRSAISFNSSDGTLDEPPPKRLKVDNEIISKSPEVPANVDPDVWKELPLDVQRELIRSWAQPETSSTSYSKSKETRSKSNNTTMFNQMKK